MNWRLTIFGLVVAALAFIAGEFVARNLALQEQRHEYLQRCHRSEHRWTDDFVPKRVYTYTCPDGAVFESEEYA